MGVSAEAFVDASLHLVGKPYSEMDCQKFVEEAMKAVGLNVDKAGSNSWYRSMTWTGTPEECIAAFGSIPVGALLFIVEYDGGEPAKYRNDGIGNASHMGIKTGITPGAIHSSASRGYVTSSVFEDKTIKHGGWNRVGLSDLFDYGDTINKLLKEKGGSPLAMQTATVTAESGKTVNLRAEQSTKSALVDRVDIGTKVVVLADYGTWVKIQVDGKTGFMMANYINYDGQPDDTNDDPAWVDKVRQAAELLQEALKGA